MVLKGGHVILCVLEYAMELGSTALAYIKLW